MSTLLDAYETTTSSSYRLLGLMDDSVPPDNPEGDNSKWLLPGPGFVELQVPSEVISAFVRLESWSAAPPVPAGPWAAGEEVDLEFPSGDLALYTIDGGRHEVALSLPSPGVHRTRWQWVFNPDNGPYHSPLDGSWSVLEAPAGHGRELNGHDQFCLVQIWSAGTA
ncbi:hypothetical protein ACFQVC_27315 [Streptomyces monticola]|uniref:Uncharacterized protein n=1 Tax=Streptomyces monticola TaxID=2666263 RepID=A0ABW2JPV6_9ACTN